MKNSLLTAFLLFGTFGNIMSLYTDPRMYQPVNEVSWGYVTGVFIRCLLVIVTLAFSVYFGTERIREALEDE